MFIEQVHTEFRLLMDKSYSNSYPEIESYEIDYNINNTLLQFIHNRYGINNLYRQGFEQSQKRTDDLRNLVVTSYFVPTSTVTEGTYNIVTIDLKFPYLDSNATTLSKKKYMHYLKGIIKATLVKTDFCDNVSNISGFTPLRIVNQEEVDKLIFDPFNKPTPSNCFGVFEGNKLLIYTPSNNYTINIVKITYLKSPSIVGYINNPTILTNINPLSTYTYYEVVSSNITYDGKVYNVGDWFETNTVTNFSGSGNVRLFTGIELPDYVIRELIKYMVDNYSEILESARLSTIEQTVLPKVE